MKPIFLTFEQHFHMTILQIRISILAFCAILATGCGKQQPAHQPPQPTSTRPVAPTIPRFDGSKAYNYLIAQTNFGPRVANTQAHRNCLQYLENELRQYADAVTLQSFSQKWYDGKTLNLTNIIASFNQDASRRILLCAHWDSRPWADLDPDPKNRDKPILGANDGASGVAVLLEIARHLKAQPPTVGIDIVLFDGEDYGKESDLSNFLLGSRYFARNLPPGFSPMFGILLDMVGDAELEIPKERSSLRFAPDVIEMVWEAARDAGSTVFIDDVGPEVYDDHLPLNQAGIKTINLIDFHYPDASHRYWHTLEDTPDKCSPQSLEEVGKTLMQLIYHRMQ